MIRNMEWEGPFPQDCAVCREYDFTAPSEGGVRSKSDECGDLLAFDFWIPPKGLYSVKAILGIKDDASGCAWVYPAHKKSDLGEQLERWWEEAVVPSMHKIKRVCCDSEHVNMTAQVRTWFASKGVEFVPSPP